MGGGEGATVRNPSLEICVEKFTVEESLSNDHQRLQNTVEQELAVLLRKNGLTSGLMGGDEIASLELDVPTDSDPKTIGVQLARAIHRGGRQ